MSFAAIAKHVRVLEMARLVTKRREGREQIVCLKPKTIARASTHLQAYEKMWQARFEALDTVLQEMHS